MNEGVATPIPYLPVLQASSSYSLNMPSTSQSFKSGYLGVLWHIHSLTQWGIKVNCELLSLSKWHEYNPTS